MPPTYRDEGIRAALELRQRHPDTAVLVLSQYVEEEYASELLAEHPGGWILLKDRVAATPNSSSRPVGSPPAAPSSTPKRYPNSWSAVVAETLWTVSPTGNGQCSR